jgi:hypothetical protein
MPYDDFIFSRCPFSPSFNSISARAFLRLDSHAEEN